MSNFTRNLILAGLTLLSVTGCTANQGLDDGIEIHNDAIRKVALTYGAQSGLAWESQRINAALEQYGRELDRIYNFNSLMLYGQVVPPVIEESIYYRVAKNEWKACKQGDLLVSIINNIPLHLS